MDVLLTGGTGYIGSGVLDELRGAGHAVTAVVRSDAAAERVAAEGTDNDLMDVPESAF